MGGFRSKLQQFMYGRYGADNFNNFIIIASLILMILSWFTTRLFYLFALLLLVYGVFRMLSRNHSKRYAENSKYLAISGKIKSRVSVYKKMWQQRKTHKFFKCPSCHQYVRVPKGHGNVQITCPKCRMSFNKTT